MGLQADAKDITIARLAVNLTLQAQRADDAEQRVVELEAKVKELEDQLAMPVKKNGAAVG